jgi:sulfoxide reductase heme-binding subunit YedZ
MVKPIRFVDLIIFAVSLLVMAMIVVAQMKFLQGGLIASDSELTWHLIRATGFVGYLALGGSMVWGLSLTTGAAKTLSLGAWTSAIHVSLSWIAVALSMLHALLLLVDKNFNYGLLDIIVPFRDEFAPVAIGMGIIGFWLLLVINLSFQIRKQMGHRAWKLLHLTSYAAFGMVTYHTLLAGTDSHVMGLHLATAAMLAGTIGFLSIRVITYRRL